MWKPATPIDVGIAGNPLPFGDGVVAIGIGPHHAAGFADIVRGLRQVPAFRRLVPAHVGPDQRLHVAAGVARHMIVPHVGRQPLAPDRGGFPQCRRAADQRLAIPERALPFRRQRQRIAFTSGGYRETIDFISNDNPHRTRRQPGRTVGADDRQPAAGEDLLAKRVAAVARQWRLHLAGKTRRVAYHWRQPILRPGFGHFDGWLHHQDRRRVLIDMEADDVAQGFGVADLRSLGDDDAGHRRVGDRVHHAAKIFRARGVPMSGLGTGFRRQISLAVGPLRNRQRRRRRKRGQRRGNDPAQCRRQIRLPAWRR